VQSVIAILVLLSTAYGLLELTDADPLTVLPSMLKGAFGSESDFGETTLRFVPIAVIAIGLIPSMRIGVFNIGIPGQMGTGALFATCVSLAWPNLPSAIALPLACFAGMLGGALCALIPAWLRMRLNVKEILTTLVLNFLVVLALEYLLTGPLKGFRVNLPQSDPLPQAACLPLFGDGSRANWGVIAVAAVFVAAWILDRGPIGYKLRLLGAAPKLARQAGLDVQRSIFITLCVGGALAGMGGWLQVAGVDHRLYSTVAAPVAFTPLFAVLMGGLKPCWVLFSSFIFASVLRGGDSLQVSVGISPEIISVLVGLLLLLVSARRARWGLNDGGR
jgi:simple sugar transport system permease protein